jgi:electron transfer flavoprotein alpha subunit
MKPNILILAETKGGEVDSITYELMAKGRTLADEKNGEVSVLVMGEDTAVLQSQVSCFGADKILVCESSGLKDYNAPLYADMISDAIKTYDPGLVMMGYTYFGIEVGTVAAAKAKREIVSNCSDLSFAGNAALAVRPVVGGTVLTKVELDENNAYALSFEKGVFQKATEDHEPAAVESMDVNIASYTDATKVLEIIKQAAGEIDITQANILISVGRGIGDKDKISVVRELADALGGVVSCSRPIADMGWLPVQQQVGISANYVTPDVYIACGISGASQHVAAMRDSTLIIAINKDANAPIFRVADYGIVGDLFDVIPAIVEEAKKIKNERLWAIGDGS